MNYRNIKICGNANIKNCQFGFSNAIYENTNLLNSSFGDFTYVSSGTKINYTTVGKFCSIGPDCKIGMGMHPSNTFVSTHPSFFSLQKQAGMTFCDKPYFEEYKEINIGHDVWIGANVIILDGVSIGNGAIIGAGSVVTKDVEAYSIIVGTPAHRIKYRFTPEEMDKLNKSKWWDKDISWIKENYKIFHDVKKFNI